MALTKALRGDVQESLDGCIPAQLLPNIPNDLIGFVDLGLRPPLEEGGLGSRVVVLRLRPDETYTCIAVAELRQFVVTPQGVTWEFRLNDGSRVSGVTQGEVRLCEGMLVCLGLPGPTISKKTSKRGIKAYHTRRGMLWVFKFRPENVLYRVIHMDIWLKFLNPPEGKKHVKASKR